MKIHEYQAKELLGRYGIPVPGGVLALTADEAAEAAAPMGVDVSGGVASALDPRIKEHKSITAFINAVRSIK